MRVEARCLHFAILCHTIQCLRQRRDIICELMTMKDLVTYTNPCDYATMWTRRDLNPRPPPYLERMLILQGRCSTKLSYRPINMYALKCEYK